jgi:hypothetical protein
VYQAFKSAQSSVKRDFLAIHQQCYSLAFQVRYEYKAAIVNRHFFISGYVDYSRHRRRCDQIGVLNAGDFTLTPNGSNYIGKITLLVGGCTEHGSETSSDKRSRVTYNSAMSDFS